MAHCVFGERCIWLFESYRNESVRGVRDYVSLGFGLISVFSWAVAEIPQIFTNFKNGSTEGVSLAFLMTWVAGDVFNLIGCLLEPATLPTQFYTALVYTITTVVLVWQTLYYGHIRKWLKTRKAKSSPEKKQFSGSKDRSNHTKPVNVPENKDYSAELGKKNDADNFKKSSNGTPASSLPIPTFSPAHDRSVGRNLYYMSARSLASSHTPTPGSYLAPSSRGSGRSGPSYILNQSSVDEEGLLANTDPSPKNSKTILRSVAATVLFVGGFNYFHLQAITAFDYTKTDSKAAVAVVLTGRKILQEASTIAFRDSTIHEQSVSPLGTWLGWIMAAIYMGGRFPQIWKNVQRGTVEGLNPLMFLFALIGNAAYVASILVKTLEWKELKPNMPWLVDAAACVLLDIFILAQFIYYRTRKDDQHEDNINGNYEAIKS